jgi:predicted nucleic acid-binding protein
MLDADVIIRGERGTFDLAAWMTQHENEGFEVAAITVAELWHGIERASGGHRARRGRYIRSILEQLPMIPYTETTALQHARIWALLDKRHFERVEGLKVVEPK